MSEGARLKPGTVFAGDYRVIQPLGAGGMGAVYLVEQQSTGARRALKLMLPAALADPASRRRFEREAKAASLIDSDHVVQVLAAGVDDASGAPWLVMELLEGEDLAAFARAHAPLPVADVIEIVRQLGHALTAAHEVGVVHRDLKPENLFVGSARRLDSRFTVKVLDFGIAKFATAASASSGTAAVGSLAWMAPEQTEAGAKLEPTTDVFAVGLIAFWMLSGKPYWRSVAIDAGSAAALLRELLLDPMPAAAERAAVLGGTSLPAGFDAWFARATAREPESRFPDGGAACAELVRVLTARGSDAAAEAPTSLAATSPPRWRARRSIAAIAGVLAIAAGTFAVVRGRAAATTSSGSTASPPDRAAASMEGATDPLRGPSPPTPITSRPAPRCVSPKVLALYRAALQEFRDANWTHAQARLQEAAGIEPECAAVQLRLALAADDIRDKRAAFQRASEHRASLDERDTVLLGVLEPWLRQARDDDEVRRRSKAAAERFPNDAELVELVAMFEPDDTVALAFSKRAADLDPLYADSWQEQGKREGRLGHDDAARKALDHCVEVSPTTADCRRDRGRLLADAGRCADAEVDYRQAMTSSPKDRSSRELLINLFYQLDRPKDAIVAALEEKWGTVPEGERAVLEALDRHHLDRWLFDDAAADADLATAADAAAKSPDREQRLEVLHAQARWFSALGKVQEAGRVADELVNRSQSPEYRSPMLGYLRFRAGLVDLEALEASRAAWKKTAKHDDDGWHVWRSSYFSGADDPDEAARALAHLPPGPPPTSAAVELAWFYEQAGRHAEALSQLARDRCGEHDVFVAALRARVLEGTGDAAGACAGYRALERRMGTSKVLAATRVRDGIKRLRCAR